MQSVLSDKVFALPKRHLQFVLVETSHPGNIGSAARAIKTMGLSSLTLVSPKVFPSEEASAMASGARDVLEAALVVPSLEAALADCQLVVGASARSRSLPWPMLDPREMAQLFMQQSEATQIAVVLGRENSGLTNDELALCHYHVQIPSDASYGSLNLAQAAQVLAYEWRMAQVSATRDASNNPWGVNWDQPLAKGQQLAGLFEHWQQVMVDIDFANPKQLDALMNKLRRLIMRAHPDEAEVNVLRGFFSQIERRLNKSNKPRA